MRRVFICKWFTCLTQTAKMTLFTGLEQFFEGLSSLISQAKSQLHSDNKYIGAFWKKTTRGI